MEKLITLTAVAAPINVDNMDTDQLMPKQFLRGIDKSGLAKGLLYNHRHLSDGTTNHHPAGLPNYGAGTGGMLL